MGNCESQNREWNIDVVSKDEFFKNLKGFYLDDGDYDIHNDSIRYRISCSIENIIDSKSNGKKSKIVLIPCCHELDTSSGYRTCHAYFNEYNYQCWCSEKVCSIKFIISNST